MRLNSFYFTPDVNLIKNICRFLNVFSFHLVLDTLGWTTQKDCLHVLQGNKEKLRCF